MGEAGRLLEVIEEPYCEYHEAPGIRATQLKALRPSSNAYVNAKEWTETPSTRLGRIFHEYLLEPADFAARYAEERTWPAPKWKHDGRTKDGKAERKAWADSPEKLVQDEERKAWAAEVEGLELISTDDLVQLRTMAAAVLRHEVAAELLATGGHRERSVYWREPVFGQAKARIDLQAPLYRAVVDLKTTRHATLREFASSVHAFGYALQGAWYLRGAKAAGLELDRFIIIGVQNAAPFEVFVCTLSPEWIAYGHREIDALAERWAGEVLTQEPQFAEPEHVVLEPPPWVERDVLDLEAACYGDQEGGAE